MSTLSVQKFNSNSSGFSALALVPLAVSSCLFVSLCSKRPQLPAFTCLSTLGRVVCSVSSLLIWTQKELLIFHSVQLFFSPLQLFLVEFIGVTLVNKILYVSSVQFYNIKSVCCISIVFTTQSQVSFCHHLSPITVCSAFSLLGKSGKSQAPYMWNGTLEASPGDFFKKRLCV